MPKQKASAGGTTFPPANGDPATSARAVKAGTRAEGVGREAQRPGLDCQEHGGTCPNPRMARGNTIPSAKERLAFSVAMHHSVWRWQQVAIHLGDAISAVALRSAHVHGLCSITGSSYAPVLGATEDKCPMCGLDYPDDAVRLAESISWCNQLTAQHVTVRYRAMAMLDRWADWRAL